MRGDRVTISDEDKWPNVRYFRAKGFLNGLNIGCERKSRERDVL